MAYEIWIGYGAGSEDQVRAESLSGFLQIDSSWYSFPTSYGSFLNAVARNNVCSESYLHQNDGLVCKDSKVMFMFTEGPRGHGCCLTWSSPGRLLPCTMQDVS